MQPGQLLCDRYRVEKALAAGGFGQTFVAVDTHLPSKPQVVVKLLKPQQSDPATLQIAQRLFNTEAQTLEKLGRNSDRIPSLYAYFELGGEFYLVQEFIAGTTLKEELQERKISESDTLDILKEILTGLTTVHRQNIIHRDLKPDNIIRRKIDRKLVLIDFGAIKQIRAATAGNPNTLISQTIPIGTPGYMPTEQGMGSPKLASDVYAVGAIAVQCLTGSHPYSLFDNDTLQLEWQRLCRVNRDVAKVIDRMVAPDYRQRYANATEALQAIEPLISSRLIPPQAPPKPMSVSTPITPPIATIQVVRAKPAQTAPTFIRPKPLWMGIVRYILINWVLNAIAFLVTQRIIDHFLPGEFRLRNFATAMIAALVLGLINTSVLPILKILTFPLTMLTFGLSSLAINVLCLMFVSWYMPGFYIAGIVPVIASSFLLSILSTLLQLFR